MQLDLKFARLMFLNLMLLNLMFLKVAGLDFQRWQELCGQAIGRWWEAGTMWMRPLLGQEAQEAQGYQQRSPLAQHKAATEDC